MFSKSAQYGYLCCDFRRAIHKRVLVSMHTLLSRLFLIALLAQSVALSGQDDHSGHESDGHGLEEFIYDHGKEVMHHIGDANEFHVWKGVHLPLPCILYAPDAGWTMMMSSAFDHGHKAVDGYVLNHGRVNRIVGEGFPEGEVAIGHIHHKMIEKDGKEKEVAYVEHDRKEFLLDQPTTYDGGLLGGGVTSFYDFSITKNVFTMLLGALILIIVFLTAANGYKTRQGMAPKGIQSFIEPFFIFIRDEVSIPMIGEKKYERFQPFILSLFFFILISNLLGLIPFFPGSANVTGNIAVTFMLAVITFVVTNLNGNRHYWEHTLWMPGVPIFVKPILTIVEFLGLFIKPFSLMVRLFANITAGHIIILSLIGLIFLFSDSGNNIGGAFAGGVLGMAFAAFMNLIELLVAFLQAFIFAILTASYIGAATEEAHH